MVRAYKIREEVYQERGTYAANHRKGKGATANLGTVPIRYIVVDGKPYYNFQDFTGSFKYTIDRKHENRMDDLNTIATSRIVGNEGQGTIFALKRGLYCDLAFMTFACDLLKLVDRELLEGGSMFALTPAQHQYYHALCEIAEGTMKDVEIDPSYPAFKLSDFYRVVPSTCKGSAGGQDKGSANVPLTEEGTPIEKINVTTNVEDELYGILPEKEDKSGIIKPENEQPEPVATPNIEENHPVDKDSIKAATSLNSGISKATEPVDASKFTEALHDVEVEIKGIAEALLKGRKIHIDIEITVE